MRKCVFLIAMTVVMLAGCYNGMPNSVVMPANQNDQSTATAPGLGPDIAPAKTPNY
jgi:hypothetical protein